MPGVIYPCPTCGRVFGTSGALRTHHSLVHGERIEGEVETENVGGQFEGDYPEPVRGLR